MPAGHKRDRRSASTSSGTESGSGSSTGSGSSSSGSDSECDDNKRKRNPEKKRKPRSPGSPGARPSRDSVRNSGRRDGLPTPPRGERRGEQVSGGGGGGGAAAAEAAPPVAAAAAAAASKFEQAEAMKKAGGRTGGIYVPPFKLAALQKEMSQMDKASKEYQRLKWEQLRKGINGLVNKINVGNLKELVPELFELNLVRGRGLLARAIMKAQLASPG